MADEHLYRSARLEDSSRTMSQRVTDLNQRFESLDQKHRVVLTEKEALALRLKASDNEIESLEDELESVREERDNAVHAGEDHAQWLRLLRRDLESTTGHEAIQTVLTAAEAHSENYQDASSSPSARSAALSTPDMAWSMIEYGQDYPLYDTVSTVKSTLMSLVKSLHTSSNIVSQKEATILKVEQQLIDLKANFSDEKNTLTDQTKDLMEMLKNEKAKSQKVSEELNTFLAENDNLKAQLHDQHQIRNELEDESITLKDTIKELRHTLKDAEVLCVDLRSKIRQLTTDKEHLSEDVTLAREEVSISLRRITDLELHLEQSGLSLGRLKAERDTLSNIKLQLTHELEVSRREAAAAAGRDNKPLLSNEDMKATFELERLLATLGATLDHLHVTMESKPNIDGAGGDEAVLTIRDSAEEKNTGDVDVDNSEAVTITLTQRVENAVKRLAAVRTWSRDERRHKRAVEETLNHLRTELERLKCTHSQESEENMTTIQDLRSKEHHLLLQTTSMASMKAQIQELEQDIINSKKERDELMTTVGNNKQTIASNVLSIQAKDLEISKLKHSLDHEKERNGDLQDNIMQLQSELEARQTLCDQQDATIRSLKATSQRQKDSVDRLETLLARQKKEKEEMDKKLKYKSEGNDSEAVESTQKIRALEVELRESKHSHRKELAALTEKLQVEASDHATALSSIVTMEGKLQSVTTDAATQRKDLLSMTQEVDRLRARLEKETQEHKQTMSSLTAVQALEGEWRQTAEDCQVLREESDAKLEKTLDQLDEMQQELAEVTDARNACQQQVTTSKQDINQLKQSVEQLTLKLDRSQREAQSATSRGSALRSEGRQIRSEVLAAVKELKEVMSVLQSLTSINADLEGGAMQEESKEQLLLLPAEPTEHELGETLGAKQLHTSIQVIHQYIAQIQKYPHEISTTHSALRTVEMENARLQRELETIDTLHADRVQRLHAELQAMESQLQDRANYDVTQGSSYADQLKELQAELNRVRERAQVREEEFQEEVRLLTADKMRIEGFHEPSVRSRSNSYELFTGGAQHASSEQSLQIESLTSQLRSAHKEIDAIRHHRSVLQSTVTELETLVYQDPSPNKTALQSTLRVSDEEGKSATAGSFPLESAAEYVESLKNDVSRLNRRLTGTEKLASIYRTALLALYVDGSFYDSLPVDTGVRDTDNEGHPLGLGWIEKDVAIITSSYVEEIHSLKREIVDWQFQVKQGDTYRSELRARLEDTLKALYRAGKGETNSMLAHQLEHLARDLQQSNVQISHLTQQLTAAQEGKHRHFEQLVEEVVRVQQARDDFIKETTLKDRQTQRQTQAHSTEKQALQTKLDKAEHDLQASNRETSQQRQHLQEQSRVISNLRQELIRADGQLESARRLAKQQKPGSTVVTSSTAVAHSRPVQESPMRGESSDAYSRRPAPSYSTDRPYRPPTPPARTRYSRGLDESLDGADHPRAPVRTMHSTNTATPPRASSTSRLGRTQMRQSQTYRQSQTNEQEAHTVAATPERTARSKSTQPSQPVMTPPAVVRVRTSRAQPSTSPAPDAANTPTRTRRRPSLESIGSNSGEKPAYTSTRNGTRSDSRK